MLQTVRLLLVLSLCGLTACTGPAGSPALPSKDRLTVSAAANLVPAFGEIGPAFTAATGIPVTFNFGSSGNLTQQIEQGAPVDLFVAADQSFVAILEEAGLIIPDTVAVYAVGRLTIWTRSDSPFALDNLTDLTDPAVERIAIANPELAPYGILARQSLQNAGVWDAVAPKIILADNIGQTLQYAETGNVDVALVALALSLDAGEAGRWTLVPDDLHDPLYQALGVVSTTQREADARRFAEFLMGEQGRAILDRYGYLLPDDLPPGATE